MTEAFFFIDFDSTFTQVEALDELCEICYPDPVERSDKLAKIQHYTTLGMEGKISLEESLDKRLGLLRASKRKIELLTERLRSKVSVSFQRNAEFLRTRADHIYILSNGFKEFIIPIVTTYGIKPDHVYANSFLFDDEGYITGYDKTNMLARSGGKPALIRSLNLPGDIYMIGDGYTDYEVKQSGVAKQFIAFTENVARQVVTEKADAIAPSLDEFLYVNNLPMAISYPKSRIRILLTDDVPQAAVSVLRNEGYQVDTLPDTPDEDTLKELIKNASLLGVRSKTNLLAAVLEKAQRLMAIGYFGLHTDHIELDAAAMRGIPVFNAPFAQTRSVAEMAIGWIWMLMRGVHRRNTHENYFTEAVHSHLVKGKTLGIIGMGGTGAELAMVAEGMGMQVIYYDMVEKQSPGNARPVATLIDLLQQSDAVSIHTGKSRDNILNDDMLSHVKPGAIVLAFTPVPAIDIHSAIRHLDNHLIKALVIETTQPIDTLPVHDNVYYMHHAAGVTEEALYDTARFVSRQLIDYINTGSTTYAVNFPTLQLPAQKNAHRFVHIHRNMPGILAGINQGFAEYHINIEGQYLKTTHDIGYVITDINREYDKQIFDRMKSIEGTIKFRVLY